MQHMNLHVGLPRFPAIDLSTGDCRRTVEFQGMITHARFHSERTLEHTVTS